MSPHCQERLKTGYKATFYWQGRKNGQKVPRLLSVTEISPLKVSSPCSTHTGARASGTWGGSERGMPTSSTPAETRRFATSAPGNVSVQGDFFSPAAFRGAVKSSPESYSAWETALSRLRNRGPWQVPEPSEERLVTPARRNSKFSNASQAAWMHLPLEPCSICLLQAAFCQKRGKPCKKRAGDAVLADSS